MEKWVNIPARVPKPGFNMARIWAHGATILMPSLEASARSQLEVLVSRLDCINDCLTLEARIPIPLSGNAEILTSGCVIDSELGIFRSYLVIQECSSVVIGRLDLDEESFEFVAQFSLPESSGTLDMMNSFIQGCLLANGPTVLGIWEQQLLVVTSRSPEMMFFSKSKVLDGANTVQPLSIGHNWEANLFAFSNGIQDKVLNIHYCGEITRVGLDVVLSVTQNSSKVSANIGSDIYPSSWFYLSLIERAHEPFITRKDSQRRMEVYRPFTLVSKQIPTDLAPTQVSCIQVLPAGPCSTDVPNDLFIGTTDKRLLKCRRGLIIESIDLEGIPANLHFAMVAGGQGVIVVVLEDDQESVIAICAESLQKLQYWSRIRQVIVGDFNLCGHDQIALLEGSISSMINWELSMPLARNGVDITFIFGFSNFDSTPHDSQQHLTEVKAVNNHQLSGLETVLKALYERTDNGIAQLKVAEHERESKRELYQVAACVIQGTVARHMLPSLKGNSFQLGKNNAKDQKPVLSAKSVKSRICGMNLLLLIEIGILQAWSHTVLHDVSLFVTSLNGSVDGRSSVLKSMVFEDSECIVITIPLRTLSLLPGVSFHIFVRTASVSISSGPRNPQDVGPDDGKRQRAYIQWLCSSEVINPTSVQPLELKEATTFIANANQHRQFVVATKSKDCLPQMAQIFRSELYLQYIDGKFKLSEGVFNLVSMTGMGILYAEVCRVGTHAILTLKTSSVEHMGMILQSLMLLTHQHQFQLCPGVPQDKTLEQVSLFAEALVEELEHRKIVDECTHQASPCYAGKLKLHLATDRRFAELLSSLL